MRLLSGASRIDFYNCWPVEPIYRATTRHVHFEVHSEFVVSIFESPSGRIMICFELLGGTRRSRFGIICAAVSWVATAGFNGENRYFIASS